MKRCDVTDEELDDSLRAWGRSVGPTSSRVIMLLTELKERRALDERQALERSMAYEAAVSVLDAMALHVDDGYERSSQESEEEAALIDEALSYLELRGLVEHGADGQLWVRDESEATDGD